MWEWIEEHPLGCVLGVVAAIALVVVFFTVQGSYKRVDNGYAGILVDYAAGASVGKPVVKTLSPGQYVFVPPLSGQQLIEYPVSQQQLVLASRGDEGELKGDSTIACQMGGGGVLNMGLTVNWAVDANHPETLYFKKPGIPLTSELNQDINTTMVYGAVRSDLLDLCTHYSWQDILGDGTKANQIDDLKKQLLQRLQDDLLVNGIVVRQVFIGDRIPDKTIQAVLNARNEAQQSAYLKQKAQYEADAAIAKAKGDAQSISILNDQLSRSKDYLKYLAIQRWDGKLPQYMGGQGDPFVAIGGK